jgi:PPOX class probable F420-dependent enzyme
VTELPEDIRAPFDGANIAHVATLLPDGAPHSVPVWVALEGDRIAFLAGPGSRKARNLERAPRVAISVTDRERPFVMAQVRRRVVERVEGNPAWTVIDRLSEKYIGAPHPLREGRVIFLVEPEHASGLSYA